MSLSSRRPGCIPGRLPPSRSWLWLRLHLLEDDLGFGFTLRANRGGAAFGFGDRALTLGAGEVSMRWRSISACFSTVAMSSSRGARFPLPALSLALHAPPAGHARTLQSPFCCMTLVSISYALSAVLALLGHFQVAGFLDVQVALRFGLLGQRCGLGRDALLVGLCFRNSRGPRCFSAL